MSELLHYILSEVKNNRIGKEQALRLIQQYKSRADRQECQGGEVVPREIELDSVPAGPKAAGVATDEPCELMTFEEAWREQPLQAIDGIMIRTIVCITSVSDHQHAILQAANAYDNRLKTIFVSLRAPGPGDRADYHVDPCDAASYARAFAQISADCGKVDAIFSFAALEDASFLRTYAPIVCMLQAIASSGLACSRVLLTAELSDDVGRCHAESWIGFDRSMALAMPQLKLAAVYRESGATTGREPVESWLPLLLAELGAAKSESVLYRDAVRHVCRTSATVLQESGGLLKAGGTYLITGGVGGLGYLLAEHLVTKYAANLILTGRGALDETKLAKVQALTEHGSEVLYVQADVSDLYAMQEAVSQGRARFGCINGVVHAAGNVDNVPLAAKSMEAFDRVLAPKVTGTLVLDEALDDEPLDFICYFSSLAAVLGDFGSCDYAVANRFQFAYAAKRRVLRPQEKTVVIAWPLWEEGGMGAGANENTRLYLASSGQRALGTEEGIAMFERLLPQSHAQHLVIVGQASRVERMLGMREEYDTSREQVLPAASGGWRPEMKGFTIQQCVEWDLKRLASELLKIPRNKLGRDDNLADFGFDSISLATFSAQLSRYYGMELTPAVLFGYPTLARLTGYLCIEHESMVNAFYKAPSDKRAPVDGSQETPDLARVTRSRRMHAGGAKTSSANSSANDRQAKESLDEPIAIIGMSGRFPQARNIDEMWKILAEGRDAIQSPPEDRLGGWEHVGYKCGFVPGASEFDPLFFEISPREAELMDPRQRLLLQEAWRALEDAGYGKRQLEASRTGMFVGVEDGDYQLLSQGDGNITGNHNGVLAARLAYFMNFSGPAMAINTACSSGLVALHQACMSLRNMECDTAIAAAANLMLTPQIYTGMQQSGMVSPDERCHTFDEKANGMVPAEAVAVVVLKRLSRAEADGDPIYAVVRGSGINYDGKTNGITAPSGVSQASLLRDVYTRYRVNPEEIGYVVAHGTGTKLGDPVEVNALNDAFKAFTNKEGYCALTSSKTNFGHALAASGLVSLIGLVQALRHELIPPNLNCEQENSFIQWKGSPFYVNKSARAWREEAGPRTGVVSAFGMSGTNAHVVVQSYQCRDIPDARSDAPCYLLALSAKTDMALRERIAELVAYLHAADALSLSLAEISRTLLDGRQHFSFRCAVVVQDVQDAIRALTCVGSGEKLPNVFEGKVTRDFVPQKMLERCAEQMLQEGAALLAQPEPYREILLGLADLYRQGYTFNWTRIYGDNPPRRTHLPTYPFSREHYWVPEEGRRMLHPSQENNGGASSILHPLLHRNTSTFTTQRFSSMLTGKEFFLAHHVLNGKRLLPGVTHLEMARAAMTHALDATGSAPAGLRLKNVVFLRPVVVDEKPVEVHIALHPQESGEISYELYSEGDAHSAGRVLHSQGVALIGSPPAEERIDIDAAISQCTLRQVSHKEFYDFYESIGFTYGPGFMVVDTLHVSEEQVVGKLQLPPSIAAGHAPYVLHPGIMDASLQASVALFAAHGTSDGNLALPFALQELEMLRPCTPSMWAVARYNVDSKPTDTVRKLDIQLCDEAGNVCVRLHGFSVRELKAEFGSEAAEGSIGTLLLQTEWKARPIPDAAIRPDYQEHVVLLCGMEAVDVPKIETGRIRVHCIDAPSPDAGDFTTGAEVALELLKDLMQRKPTGPVLMQIVVPALGACQSFAGLSGMLKTAQQENTRLCGQLIAIDEETGTDQLIAILEDNSRSPGDQSVRYQEGERFVAGWKELDEAAAQVPWKAEGVYLITGGAGGLGLIFANEIAQRAPGATIVLTGRSRLSPERKEQLLALERTGAKVDYREADVARRDDVIGLMQHIQESYGGLNGIVHAAGVLRDSFVFKKTREELREVLAPKVDGLIHLDEASRDMQLDCFVCFSSASAAFGNIGQADYAAANAFMDAYAAYRNSLVALNQRHGQTLSVNWPLWKEGGMHVDISAEQILTQRTGMIALRTETGIEALYRALGSGQDQVVVMEGNLSRMKQQWLSGRSRAISTASRSGAAASGDLVAAARKMLIGLVSKLLKLKPDEIDGDAEFIVYGFDSLTLTEFRNTLYRDYHVELTPTVFFEHSTLNSFAEYLAREHGEIFSGGEHADTPADALLKTVASDVPAKIEQGFVRFPSRLSAAGGAQAGGRATTSHHTEDGRDCNSALQVVVSADDPALLAQKLCLTYVEKSLEEAGLRANDQMVDVVKSTATGVADYVKTVIERMRDEAPQVSGQEGQHFGMHVGFRITTIQGEQGIPVAMYYPTSKKGRTIQMGPFMPTVAVNGELPESVRGLILLSHGTGGNEMVHHNIAESLALRGYLVVAPQHPGDNWHDNSLAHSQVYFSERPKQLSRVLDAILEDKQWKHKIPAECVGAIGHSVGGFSVLALAGGMADPARLVEHCRSRGEDDARLCAILGTSLQHRGDAEVATVSSFDVMDQRIRAVIAMAPLGVVFTPESLARIQIPLKIYTAEKDAVFNGKYHGNWLRAQLPAAEFDEVSGAGHFAFMARFGRQVMSPIGDPNEDPEGFDRSAYQVRLVCEVGEFFDRHLGAERLAGETLCPEDRCATDAGLARENSSNGDA